MRLPILYLPFFVSSFFICFTFNHVFYIVPSLFSLFVFSLALFLPFLASYFSLDSFFIFCSSLVFSSGSYFKAAFFIFLFFLLLVLAILLVTLAFLFYLFFPDLFSLLVLLLLNIQSFGLLVTIVLFAKSLLLNKKKRFSLLKKNDFFLFKENKNDLINSVSVLLKKL